jgi:hypothetical protein
VSGRRAKERRRAERQAADAHSAKLHAGVTAPAPKLGWKEQRVLWNKLGQCAREACRASLTPGAFRHPDTALLYCRACRRLLEDMNPCLVLEAA